jgi:hypothetical protein
MLCTLSDIRLRLGLPESNTENDALFTQLISSITSIFESYTGRDLILNVNDVTEYLEGGSPWIRLKRYPVVSITSIKESLDFDFASADSLVVNDDYRLRPLTGLVLRQGPDWIGGIDAVEVKYKGGYCAAGVTPQAGEFGLPADLREAAISQAVFFFKRKDDIGLSGVSFEGGSFNKLANYELLPLVKQTLDQYKRTTL